ncbi:MAG: carboxypeptidase-like regulatory domain-containing protein, partial [Cytophagaceae bacterium]
MKHLFLVLIFLILRLLIPMLGQAQGLSQTVRGTVVDSDSQLPLIGATVLVTGSKPLVGTTTDVNGNFKLTSVPTGRITLLLSYLGYEPKAIPDIVVNSGKEVVLTLSMQESTQKLAAVVVTANQAKGQALNEMALISARSISPEETSRYAGGFNDPSLIMSNFAGVANNPNGNNDIIVRGNSPKYVQWRLEGVQITNPNHFADQGAIGGGLSTLNNNILATSDFYTGAFAPEYGDVLSGVYDVKLRTGNNEKREAVLGVGILGTDLTLEGPLKKGYGGSYLVNYRYS